jgi:DNA repair exonuclease SbcCD nuclease subunit
MTNLFKKAAVFTDIHYGLRNNSEQHNVDCSDFIDWFIATAKAENCDTCLFLGDYHHYRSTINIRTLQFAIRGLEKLSANFEHVYFITGNHDLFHKSKRDVHSVEWASHLPNVTIVNDWFSKGNVVIAPWLVDNDWKRLQKMKGKYLFGHFELPHFHMNALVAMPDHNELQTNHLTGFDTVFSGHFHKRQFRDNVIYIGNAFPHNFSDVGDDDRGMMILEWDTVPKFKSWPGQPKFRIFNLSDILEDTDKVLQPGMHVKVNLDIDITFEEANFIREQFIPKYNLREMTLVPIKADIETDITDYTNLQFETVDSIILKQLDQLQQGSFDKQLLLEIYKNL